MKKSVLVSQKDITHKKTLLIGLVFGFLQISYIILYGVITDWVKVSDPMAHSIYHYVILPFSIFLLVMSVISGWFYAEADYKKPIKYSLLISLISSSLISLGMLISGTILGREILGSIFYTFIILSPLLLLIAFLIGKWKLSFK